MRAGDIAPVKGRIETGSGHITLAGITGEPDPIAVEVGDEMKVMLMGMKRFTKLDPYNMKDLRRAIADEMIEQNRFPYQLYN